ncbi:MAG: terminase small subunit [Acutalibacteraceae bacterium]
MKKHLTSKEKLFCAYFRAGRNAREAAAKSGYLFPEKAALKLLEKKEIRNELFSPKNEENESEVMCGYRRLAFGCNADAVGLIFCDEQPDKQEIEKMDLFGVSEIKRQKGGAVEIKFFDRLKALEKLESFTEKQSDDGENKLYSAIENSAVALGECCDEE